MTKICREQRSVGQRRERFGCEVIWPREFKSDILSLLPSAHTPLPTLSREKKGTEPSSSRLTLSTWHFEELQRPLSVKGAKLNRVKKNIVPKGKDPFEIPGGIRPIWNLLWASVPWTPPLRNSMAGDLWETPQVSRGSCFDSEVGWNVAFG